jgi:hypothetical protein
MKTIKTNVRTAERAALTPVIDALNEAAGRLPDASEWKRACVGIRREMALSVGVPLVRVVPRAPVRSDLDEGSEFETPQTPAGTVA